MKTIYFGDSITAGFQQLDQHHDVINLGVSGDKINNLIGRVEEVISYKPDQLVIMIGVNDYLNMKNYWGSPIKLNIKYMYGVLIKLLHDNLPNCKIVCLSILPVSMDIEPNILREFNLDIIKLNSYIKTIAATYLYEYLDIHQYFIDSDGKLDAHYTTDGVHLSDEGYKHYYSFIRKYF